MSEFEYTQHKLGRQYTFSNGKCYFGVTSMLDATKDKRGLMKWRKRVGNVEADRICKVATTIGTAMHESLEFYLNKQPYIFTNSVVKMLFNQIKPYIDQKVKHVYATEKVLWSDKLMLAGTADAFVDYLLHKKRNQTVYSVMDFKTSKRLPKIEWVQDYFIQLFVYSKMMAEMSGSTPAKYGVLLFAYKEQRSKMNQIVIKLDKYEYKAMKRIEAFHNIVESS